MENPYESASSGRDKSSSASDVERDRDHLRLLSIFHYVLGGVIFLGACFPLIYVLIGIAFLSGGIPQPRMEPPPPINLGWIFIIGGGILASLGFMMATAVIVTGLGLGRQRRYLLNMVVAALECLMVPPGTVLGIFTILVLLRPSVKSLFYTPEDAR